MILRTLITLLLLSTAVVEPFAAEANEVALTSEQVKRLDIKVEAIRPAETEPLAVLPGTVIPPLNSRIVATAPFGGTVIQVHALPGQKVVKGQPLATISSRELLEAQSQLFQAEAELQMAEAVARRKRTLVDKNFQSPSVAEEAEAQVAKIKAVIEQHRRMIKLHAITLGQGGEYTIPAPRDGTVAEASAMPGDRIDAMAATFTLDTSDEIWVEVQVPANVVSLVEVGDAVRIAGGPEGRVVSVGTTLRGTTRSAVLYAAFPNKSGILIGQLVSITVLRECRPGAFTVPAAAVARLPDQTAVFVRSNGGFKLTRVELKGRSSEVATVVGELAPDALVAASGLPQLEQLLAGN